MDMEQFRDVKIGDRVQTVFGGIGIVDKRWFKAVSILAWEQPTAQDYGHCSTYTIDELVNKV